MIDTAAIYETITMISEENLDIRTVTMGISLTDCISSDLDRLCGKIYDKICRKAENIVSACENIEKTYGIPIVNKRISITPAAIIAGAVCAEHPNADVSKIALALDKAALTVGVNFIGGYGALVHKGFSVGDIEIIRSIPSALATTERVCSFINIGSTKSGINMDAVKLAGETILAAANTTADNGCFGAAKIVVFCNAVEDNPFMAGAFHGIGEPDTVINIGVSGPGAVRSALHRLNAENPHADITEVAENVKRTAFKITRMGQLVGNAASLALGVPFGIVDLSLAPTPAIGDSVAYILEEMGLEQCGAHGTTACLALLNDAVKKGGAMACSRVGGLSGAFIPVSEDAGMIAAAESGSLTIEKLEAMTAVCSVGLDMIVVPGDTPAEIISAIIADEAAIGMINSKTTAVRLVPAVGKSVGDVMEFGGLFGRAPVMRLNTKSPHIFINRGGRIPAPLQGLRN
jgi:uncharacterized protein (UPF0210 family)